MSEIYLPPDGVLTETDFDAFVTKYFPYKVELPTDKGIPVIVGASVVEQIAGPAIYTVKHFISIKSYMLETPKDTFPYYSSIGTWFFHRNTFYFSKQQDAILFRLKFT